ncbi:cache domain-containing protein [Breznakiellaceae bacterium SP9]
MHNKRSLKRTPFAALFTVICLAIIVLITVAQSLLFFINFRTMSYKQIETTVRENASHLQNTVLAKFREWSELIQHTAFGVAPFMAQEPVDKLAIESIFKQVVAAQSDMWLLLCTNNQVWNEPGGYAVFSDGEPRAPTWNNTARLWFIGAKANPGKTVYADPYISANTGILNIAVSTSVYDEKQQDLGVISGSISVDFLETMLENTTAMPEHQTFILNKQGQFITHPDKNMVLQKNFFAESKLEPYRDQILSAPSFSNIDTNFFIYSLAIPNVDWILVSTIPTSVVFTGVNKFLFQMIGINAALIAIVVTMSTILIRILRHERNENAAMKDNLKVGFFLMDKNYTIQGQYSQALEHILSVADLKGKNFISLLAASLTEPETDTLKDYFNMVFNRSFYQELLDDINPIQELPYISVETREEKILSCGFTPVNREHNKVLILGNILDSTVEKTLKKQLAAEETKRQEEMHFLFEIIQVEHQVLKDFIDDAEYEFDKIDAILNGQVVSFKDAVVDIYQSTHAIKSNALILGLQTFGEQVHELESKIKGLRGQKVILQEDMLRLTEGIENIKGEKKRLIGIIHKIQSFRTDEKQNPHEYVLIESLTRACNKMAADLHKKVRLEAGEIDIQTIENGPRRIIKEVLMQLIRNAVYHGIESRDERREQGKDETGIISLSIKRKEGMIYIQLKDDGKGINFDTIRKKAEELHIIPNGQEENDKDFLLQTLFEPGFSTAETEGIHAGRGIGLNLVQARIQELQGTIKVDSEYRKGTVFTIFIPFLPPPPPPPRLRAKDRSLKNYLCFFGFIPYYIATRKNKE